MANINITDALKNDIAHNGDLVRSAGGDIATVKGLYNLRQALFHRLITVPGTLVHKPSYGVGIGRFQNAPNSFAMQQEIAGIIHDQFTQDPRIKKVVSVGLTSEDDTPALTIIAVRLIPVGYTELTMNFTPFSEAN